VEITPSTIFSIDSPAAFEATALAVFRYQAAENAVYKEFIRLLHINPQLVDSLEQIPFLPIEFFKTHEVICGTSNAELTFTSSGTTGSNTSRHLVKDLKIYENSFRQGFTHFYGNVSEYAILALLPAYLEREGSSLIYMVQDLITQSQHPQSGFYLHNVDKLLQTLQSLEAQQQKVLLIGVSFALLDFVEQHQLQLQQGVDGI
jgi:phenylacetate-coenzyme A ligase PaaK-like adenylate-forming protein